MIFVKVVGGAGFPEIEGKCHEEFEEVSLSFFGEFLGKIPLKNLG
jgi:hypothetical protein